MPNTAIPRDYSNDIADDLMRMWRFSELDREIAHELLTMAAQRGYNLGLTAGVVGQNALVGL